MDLNQELVRVWDEAVQGAIPNAGHLEAGAVSIFKVSEHVRATDPNAYEPKVISIGPYHRNKPHLIGMNQVKLLYFSRILKRNPQIFALGSYQGLTNGWRGQYRRCYSEEINMEEDEFLNLLLLDGCFIIELLLADHFGNHDSILDDMLTLSLVEFDMLLLENQLPFGVLKSLFDLVIPQDIQNRLSISLLGIASQFFCDLIKGLKPLKYRTLPAANFYHLLHLFHSCFIEPPGEKTESMLMTPSASDLMHADVKFKEKSDRSFSWNISYEQGIIEISPVRLNSNSNSFYRNLIAFEQYSFSGVKSQVMAYVMLMSCLIDTKKDLALLRRKRIIAYTLHFREATLFFRKLCKDSVMDYDKSYLAHLQDSSLQVWQLYDTKWNRLIAKVKRSLYGNPINFSYLVASAVFILVLTIVQTVYTMLTYYNPREPRK